MSKLLQARIHGHVQGVGFRFETLRKARELNLVGFVRNEHDKTVYVEAQGSSENVDRFLHWLEHHAPAGADVTKVEHHSTFQNLRDFGSFKILP